MVSDRREAVADTSPAQPGPTRTHRCSDQIRHKGVLGAVALLVRLRDSALQDVAGQAGVLALQSLAMVLGLAARRLDGDGRHGSTRLGVDAVAGLDLPRDVGEAVLVDDSHCACAVYPTTCALPARVVWWTGCV